MKPTVGILLLLLGLPAATQAQSFAEFLARIDAAPQAQRPALVDSFLQATPRFPLTEQDTLCHFLYYGPASAVQMAGDATQWNPSGSALVRVAGTDFWYRTEVYPADARLDYKLVRNGNDWILDPRNPFRVSGGFGPNSELRMPAYSPPVEIEFDANIPHGTLQESRITSTNLGNSRTVRVYLPAGYANQPDRHYPMVLFHDGLDYLNLANAKNVLDYLIHHQRVKPLIAVFVPAVNRNPEYAGDQQQAFTRFIVDELLAWVDSTFRTSREAADRAVMGASNGGNISLWLGLQHPEVFGHVAAQSSNVEANVAEGYRSAAKLDLRFYMDLGAYDIPILLPRVRNFVPILRQKGYDLQYAEYNEGHSWGFWRAHIRDALEMFFPAVTTGATETSETPEAFALLRNYPNPFNPTTRITLRIDQPADVSLVIYNLLGQQIRTLMARQMPAGEHAITWDGTSDSGLAQPNGVYLCRAIIDGVPADSRRMLLLRN